MKLLVVSHACATATNQKVFAALAESTGWQISLVVPDRWRDEFGNRLDQPPMDGLAVEKVPVIFNGSIISHLYRMRWKSFLERGAFDAIYVQHEPYAMATFQICFANARCGKPAVFGFSSCQNIPKHYPFPISWLESRVYRQSAFAFPITPAVAEVLLNKGFRGEVAICPLPVDTSLCFPRSPSENQRVIPRAEGDVVVGFVGRLVESKGLATLAEALVRIAALPWKLVLVGSGPMQARLEKIFAEHGLMSRVTFAGYISHHESPRFLSAMDVLVLPSETRPGWKEQFGRVIPEALACGTCVVGSDSGEIPRLVTESGGGEVFPEGRSDALARVLEGLLVDAEKRSQYARAGCAWVARELSTQAVAAKMERALKWVTGRNP